MCPPPRRHRHLVETVDLHPILWSLLYYCIIFERENSISSTCTLISNWIMKLYPVVFSNDEIPGPGGITRQDTSFWHRETMQTVIFSSFFLYREYFIDLEYSLDRKFYKYVYNLPFFVLRCVKLFKRFCCGEISALSSAIFSIAVYK